MTFLFPTLSLMIRFWRKKICVCSSISTQFSVLRKYCPNVVEKAHFCGAGMVSFTVPVLVKLAVCRLLET